VWPSLEKISAETETAEKECVEKKELDAKYNGRSLLHHNNEVMKLGGLRFCVRTPLVLN